MTRGAYCIVKTCHFNKFDNPNLSFMTLPKDPSISKKWLEFANRLDLLDDELYKRKIYTMCSNHFPEKNFKSIYPRRLLWPKSIPSLNGPQCVPSIQCDVSLVNDNYSAINIAENNTTDLHLNINRKVSEYTEYVEKEQPSSMCQDFATESTSCDIPDEPTGVLKQHNYAVPMQTCLESQSEVTPSTISGSLMEVGTNNSNQISRSVSQIGFQDYTKKKSSPLNPAIVNGDKAANPRVMTNKSLTLTNDEQEWTTALIENSATDLQLSIKRKASEHTEYVKKERSRSACQHFATESISCDIKSISCRISGVHDKIRVNCAPGT